MDVDERLSTILQECRWVTDPGTAVQLIPGLAAEAPAFVPLPLRDGDVRPSVPVVCVPMVADAVVRTIVAAVKGEAKALEDANAVEVSADPLAAACAEMFAQCAKPGLRAQTVPVLTIAWCAWEVFAGRGPQLPGVDTDVGKASRTVAAQLGASQGTAKAEMLQKIGWALASRLSGGMSMAAMAGAPVVTGGLYRQLLPHPLVLGFPRGTLDANPADAAAVLGLSLEPDLVSAGGLAASWLLSSSRARLAAGKFEPFDVALQAVIPATLAPEAAAFHPIAGPALVAALPVLATAKDLMKVGVDKRYAKGLVSSRGARAMSSAWRNLCEGLGVWDVLSALVTRVVPLAEVNGRIVGPHGALPADARWSMLLPRPDAATTLQAVVAVRTTEVRESLQGVLVKRPWSLRNVDRSFVAVARKNGASVRMVLGDHAVCTFPAPELALRFALVVRRSLGPKATIELGDDGTTVSVPPTATLGIGLALGVVDGGSDGESAWLSGRAVAEAIALAGNGRVTGIFDDGVGVREAGWSADGLANESIVATGRFVRAVLERTRRRNRPVHVRGEGGISGGISEDFAMAPVAGWWDAGDGVVAAALLLDKGGGEGAAEVRVMREADFREWFASDRSAEALRRTAAPQAVSAPSASDQFTLRPADSVNEEPSGLDEPSLSFMGVEARGPSEPSPASRDSVSAPADGTVAEGFGFVMDEDEGGDAADEGGRFSLTPASGESRGPAPPMMMLDDEEEEEDGGSPSTPPPDGPAPPMMIDDDGDDPSFGTSSSPDPTPRGPSAPMMLHDDEPAVAPARRGPSAPMMFIEDEEDDAPAQFSGGASAPMMPLDDEPAGGLLGEVQDADPFADDSSEADVGLDPVDSVFGAGSPSPDASASMSASHATYQGEMELVGVAGFSLTAGETNQGLDPMHDPADITGFYDERVSSHPRRPGESGTQPKGRRPPDGAMVRELVRLLRGYVVVRDGSSITFGLPDGGLLRDAWSYDGDVHDAYVGFLQSKVADGFIPRADRVMALVRGVKTQPIDSDAIEKAAHLAGL